MIQTRTHFGIGLFVGVIVTALFFHFFAPRYEVIESDNMLIKQDKWSGNSWSFEGDKWEKISDSTRDWKPIDTVLMDALKIEPSGDVSSSNSQMGNLKKKYPLLEKLSNEEIMERIKYIYARRIMVDLYFSKANVKF
ncbi:hypothetical protein KAJ27_17825 [bacterium]|nr:hypothetical protein [bacterium]